MTRRARRRPAGPPSVRRHTGAKSGAGGYDEVSIEALAETFHVLGDGTRVRILVEISTTERCVQDLARLVALSESAVSHQLRLLRSHRLVRPRRAGRQVFYALDDHHIVGLFAQGLEHVQERARPRRDTAARAGTVRSS